MPTILDSLFHKVFDTTSSPIWMEGGGWWGAMNWRDLLIQKIHMAKWHQFRLFSAPHITTCSYINAQSHKPILWWLPAGYLPGWASWSHLQITRAPVDDRQAREWGLSKSWPLNLWQWYKHVLLVYCCICRMAMKSETWNCVRTRSLLANPVTFLDGHYTSEIQTKCIIHYKYVIRFWKADQDVTFASLLYLFKILQIVLLV